MKDKKRPIFKEHIEKLDEKENKKQTHSDTLKDA